MKVRSLARVRYNGTGRDGGCIISFRLSSSPLCVCACKDGIKIAELSPSK